MGTKCSRGYVTGAVVVLLAVLAMLVPAAPAAAAVGSPGPVLTMPGSVRQVSTCVTTSWRSAYWGLPKTRVGERCYATPDMWVSRYWPKVGMAVVRGRLLPVYLRTV